MGECIERIRGLRTQQEVAEQDHADRGPHCPGHKSPFTKPPIKLSPQN
jgi:hypothetical protein